MRYTRSKLTVLVGLFLLLALLGFSLSQPGEVAAFQHGWSVLATENVAAGEYGLWDNIAAGFPAVNEAGLFWFANNEALNETVAYKTTEVALNTTSYPILTVRAALNDYALFKVGYVLTDPQGACVYPVALTWTAPQAHGGYLVKSFKLPPAKYVRAICIAMTDNPDAVAIGRSNVLIDYIRIRNLAGGIGWREEFTGPP